MKKIRRFFRQLYMPADTPEEYRAIIQLAAKDSLTTGRHAVIVIIAFELIMMLYTIVSGTWRVRDFLYVGGYVFLLAASLAIFAVALYASRDKNSRFMLVHHASIWYDFSLIAWAVYMTVVENMNGSSFTALIFITVLVIIPAATYLPLLPYLILHIAGCISIFGVIWHFTEFNRFGNTVNFAVFSIISLISGCSFLQVRNSGYKKQVQLAQLADRDALSGLYNRQMLGRISNEIWAECCTKKLPLSCILCDIDDFKIINDTCGHLVGDRWIRTVSDVLQGCSCGAQAFRYGGEEFLMVCPGKDEAQCRAIVEAMQAALRAKAETGTGLCVTLSFGVYTAYPQSSISSIEKYFSRADELMYEAKRLGKNTCCSYTETAAAPERADV